MKNSLISKMPGDQWQQFANLRLLYAWQYAHPGKKLMFMGGELGQWHEWQATSQLDWDLLQFENHRGLKTLLGDLNQLYRSETAMHRNDFVVDGFQWIDCHDSDQSVLTFMRHGDGQSIICLINFTPVPRYNYRIGLPAAGGYREILNTDSNRYGGSNLGNEGAIASEAIAWMGFENSVALTLPPLGALFLKREDEE